MLSISVLAAAGKRKLQMQQLLSGSRDMEKLQRWQAKESYCLNLTKTTFVITTHFYN